MINYMKEEIYVFRVYLIGWQRCYRVFGKKK